MLKENVRPVVSFQSAPMCLQSMFFCMVLFIYSDKESVFSMVFQIQIYCVFVVTVNEGSIVITIFLGVSESRNK